MSHITTITLKPNGSFITLLTSSEQYAINGHFEINAAMLDAFLAGEHEAFYDFDLSFALRIYRIADSCVSLHLTWLAEDEYAAWQQSFLLPVNILKRVLAGKTVNAIVDQHVCPYSVSVAKEMMLPRTIMKARISA